MRQISVVVPNRDSPAVDRTIASLEGQSIEKGLFDVLVVGSDRFDLVCESDLVRFEHVAAPLSPAGARNQGARQAEGDILAFIDSDCVARQDWLAILAERFADPVVQIVGGGVEIEGGGYWAVADNLSLFHDYLAHLPPGTREQLPSLNLALRREAFAEAGGFDESLLMGEDADLTVRLKRRGYTLHFEPRAVVRHISLRTTLARVVRRAYWQGFHSIKVHPRHAGTRDALPGLLRHRTTLLMGAPAIALGATVCTFSSARARPRWWPMAPAVYIAKAAWCLGAAHRLGHPQAPM